MRANKLAGFKLAGLKKAKAAQKNPLIQSGGNTAVLL